jgi:hypothetical protein
VEARTARTAARLIVVAHARPRMNGTPDQDIVMTQPDNGAAGAARRAQIEDALADYPHLSDERLAALIAWFRKEASALDVAQVASNEAIAEPYRRFRADHIDRLTGRDWIKGLLLTAAVAVIACLIIWAAL